MVVRGVITVSLAPELRAFIESEVSSGRFSSVDEVLTEGVRLLQERDEDRLAALQDVKKKIAEGLEAARRGELIDGEEVFRRLREKSERMRREFPE